jgi:hypothetical protein
MQAYRQSDQEGVPMKVCIYETELYPILIIDNQDMYVEDIEISEEFRAKYNDVMKKFQELQKELHMMNYKQEDDSYFHCLRGI